MTHRFINVRGCNGSGKTTLLRCLARSPDCRVVSVDTAEPGIKPIPVTITPEGYAIIGDYTRAGDGQTTAGLDRIKTQAAAKRAAELAAGLEGVKVVLFEGVVVSTIYGPWRDWAEANGGMIWAFLDTPLEVCLRRIQERNGGKPIQEQQVADKHRTLARVRQKAMADKLSVYDIHWETALKDMRALLASGS